jgi:hypothetical protein
VPIFELVQKPRDAGIGGQVRRNTQNEPINSFYFSDGTGAFSQRGAASDPKHRSCLDTVMIV